MTEQNSITFSADTEVIRIDSKGFHYNDKFIADAGEAHRLMVAFLKQHTSNEASELEAYRDAD